LDEHLVFHQYQVGADGRMGANQKAYVDVRTGEAGMSTENVPEQPENGAGHNYLKRYHYQPANPGIIRGVALSWSFDGNSGSHFLLVRFHIIHTSPFPPGLNIFPVFNCLT
jgi:hypothetical protein